MRITFELECSGCKRRNYSSNKNKNTTTQRLELKKYCPFCRKSLMHKEIKK
ncbi:MAG TPA: 50S ribosomal protein L33 [Spirochaetia bacterium]|nr:50S ribosomal protein L33 [Spirochaetia bacterium]